jgi:hypothetical protein
MGRKFDLPEGYKSAAQLLKEFREKHPDGIIETSAIVSNGDFVVVTATVKAGSLSATGIADADLQQGKGSSRAESAAIRRALVHLGFESVEGDDDEAEEQEERPKRFSRSRDEDKEEEKPKKSFSKSRDEDEEDDEEQEEEEEKPRSRFASKSSKRDDEEESEDEEEGKPKFERGSRFKRG